jgi:hypothetical protein
MNTMPSFTNAATEAIERWLTRQSTDTRDPNNTDALAPLRTRTASERVRALYEVLGDRPDLAWSTQRLPLLDQLRLTLELVRAGRQTQPEARAVASAATRQRCRARHHCGRPRPQ